MITSYGYKRHILGSATDHRTTIDQIRSHVGESKPKTRVLETYFTGHKPLWITRSLLKMSN